MIEKRRFPRHDHISTQKIVRLDMTQTPKENIILVQNFSVCGAKFFTPEKLNLSSYLLTTLNDPLIRELNQKNPLWLKSGDYFLSKVVWVNQETPSNFEIGVEFINKQGTTPQILETFTELVNASAMEKL
jgi:hypothetical protein